MSFLKYLFALVTICLVVTSGCSGDDARGVPADFFFVMDARSTEIGTAQNVNIQINTNGEGRYERYDKVVSSEGAKMIWLYMERIKSWIWVNSSFVRMNFSGCGK